MAPFDNNSVRYIFLVEPTDDQTRQLITLYREQGWWLACDEDRKDLITGIIEGSHCFVIATIAGSIIGMGRAISDGISDAYIQDLTVHRDYRNRGIGKRMLMVLLERLHADGIAWIGLIAEPGSTNLYRGAGFHEMSKAIPMLLIEVP
jgi:aralkylamine N-acetyltransferase